ncbi:MAG: DUF4083 family protein [bacterium]
MIVPNEGDIRDIKGIISYDFNFIYLIILLVLLGLIILAFVFIIRRKKKSSAAEKEIPTLPPDVSALEKIKKLRESKLIEQGKVKEFYTILSDIIRAFIEDKYKIPALDRTTYELVSELKNKNVIYGRVGIVQDFLFDCDLVKFAKCIPPKEDSDKILNTAEEIINV